MTRFAVCARLVSPPADQRTTAAQRKAAPNSDGSDGNDLTAQLARAAVNEYDKFTASAHFPMLQQIAALAEASIPALASDNNQDMFRSWINIVCNTCNEKVGALALLRKL